MHNDDNNHDNNDSKVDNHEHFHEGSYILLDSRELFTVKENTTLQERLLDYEANGVIACKKCGQVYLLLYVQKCAFKKYIFWNIISGHRF